MIEHKKRFTKKPAAAAPAKSAPAEPAKTVKTAKAEPAKKTAAPAPKPVEAPKPAAKPAAAPKVEEKPVVAPKVEAKIAAPKVEAQPAAAPKAEAQPVAPKVEAKPADPKPAPKEASHKNNIKSMPEETLKFFANLTLWISGAISLLVIIFGVLAALELKGPNSPIFLVCCIIAAVIMIIYPLIIWAFVRVFVNISKTLMKINAKLPDAKPEEK